MSRRGEGAGAWLAPLLVGVVAAAVLETAAGMLLYAGPGLMRSLTTVLSTGVAAFGAGLWSAPSPRPDLVDVLRRRWLLGFASLTAAAVWGALWTLDGRVGTSWWSQGVGLGLLAALPLYACGGILGALASDAPAGGRSGVQVFGPAAVGAALGFLLAGWSLPSAASPASLMLAGLVLLSAAGLAYGRVLMVRAEVAVLARRREGALEVRVEERRDGVEGRLVRVLLEGSAPRAWRILEPAAGTPWETAAVRAAGGDGPGRRVLVVGGGAAPPLAGEEVVIVEASRAVVELAGTLEGAPGAGRTGEGGGAEVRVGNVNDLLEDAGGGWNVILVDTRFLAAHGGMAALSRRGWRAVTSALAADGLLVLGPLRTGGDPPLPGGWGRRVAVREAFVPKEAGGDAGESLLLAAPPGVTLPAPAGFDAVPAAAVLAAP